MPMSHMSHLATSFYGRQVTRPGVLEVCDAVAPARALVGPQVATPNPVGAELVGKLAGLDSFVLVPAAPRRLLHRRQSTPQLCRRQVGIAIECAAAIREQPDSKRGILGVDTGPEPLGGLTRASAPAFTSQVGEREQGLPHVLTAVVEFIG